MNNINDSINNTAFKATFRVTSPVKDAVRLKNIQTMFSEQTKEMKDILSVSKVKDLENRECFYTGTKPENSVGAFFETSIDTMMSKLSDNDFVTKMIKVLKGLKELNKRETVLLSNDRGIYRAQANKDRNLKIAQQCRANNNPVMATRFEFLASCFGEKVRQLELRQNDMDANVVSKLEKIADGDADVLSLKDCMQV